MSKIVSLDPAIDIWLTQSWSSNNHGICGHTFEIIDYFYILKNHFNVGILFAEDIAWPIVESAIRSKYDFTEQEILEIKNKTQFENKPIVVRGTNILFVDGGVINTSRCTLLFDHIFYFACGNKEVKNNDKENVYVLQDNRVYDAVKRNGINYKKRILFDKLKSVTAGGDSLLVYATKNCRDIRNYEELFQYGDHILAITNAENRPADTDGIEFVLPPVENLFEKFSKYVYTPVNRKWDCSPRFIAECKYYGKEVIYHNIDYWDIDKGLYFRFLDIQNDFGSLFLKSNDEIVYILKDIIC
jgi:hypothetical protein